MKKQAVTVRTGPDQLAKAHLAANLAVVGLLVAANILLFLVLPAVLLAHSLLWGLLILPIVLLSVSHWAVIHEAIHGSLLPDRRAGEILGRALCILYGSPFHVVRFGHLSHHSLNGSATERPEIYDPQTSSRWLVTPGYYVRLTVGLYCVELQSGPLSLLPRRWLRPMVRRAFYEGSDDGRNMARRAERRLLERDLPRIRLDAVAVVLLFGASLYLYGAHWPLLGGAILGRAFLVSVMDNAPHYGGDFKDWAQGHDLHLPKPFTYLVLNSNLHGTHHRYPSTPWLLLPEAFARDGRTYSGSYLSVPWRQFRGPIALGRPVAGERRGRGRRSAVS